MKPFTKRTTFIYDKNKFNIVQRMKVKNWIRIKKDVVLANMESF